MASAYSIRQHRFTGRQGQINTTTIYYGQHQTRSITKAMKASKRSTELVKKGFLEVLNLILESCKQR